MNFRVYLKRIKNILAWFCPSLRSVFLLQATGQKRILGIWDFRKSPFTVGEFLYFQQVSVIIREIYQAEKIDIAMLCESEKPARFDGGMDRDNFHYYFSKYLPLAFVNQHLGSLFIFDSSEILAKYIADNHDRYIVFPPYKDNENGELDDYTQYFNFVIKYYSNYSFLPAVNCKKAVLMWAYYFLSANMKLKLPVIVHLRNVNAHLYRNAFIDAWLEFIGYCERRYDVLFVMIGEKEEIDTRFRGFSNVLIAKDYNTTIEQDLALIQTGIMFLGTTSGPATMALFSDHPYVIYGFQTVYERLSYGQQLPWATPLQKLMWEQETTEKLITDFEWLYNRIDREKWRIEFERLAGDAAIKLKKHNN